MVYNTLLPITNEHKFNVKYMVATDRFYTSVDNCMMLKNRLGMMMYGTVRADRGPHYSDIVDLKLEKGGDYVYQQAHLPVSLTLFKWRDSVAEGTWFLSTCHDSSSSVVLRRIRTSEKKRRHTLNETTKTTTHTKYDSKGRVTREAPQCCADYNKFMGAVDRSNSLRMHTSMQLKHKYRWYMCLIYYCLDVLLINSYIVYNTGLVRSIPRQLLQIKKSTGLLL